MSNAYGVVNGEVFIKMWSTPCDNNGEPIDFVITWVDGSDEEWLESKRKYSYPASGNQVDNSERRYRDWGLLRYLLRSIEVFAPWVRNIYLVTSGHYPDWLNTSANNLVLVKHSDYIPKEYLPTFSSHVIEWNLHRIDGLSENFAYFNDDTLITRPINPSLFFRNGLPVLVPQLHGILPRADVGIMAHVYVNNVMLINRHFVFHESLRANATKWFNPLQIGAKAVIENAYASMYKEFPGFRHIHLPMPLNKSLIDHIWKCESSLIHETCTHKFRDATDISPYVIWYWSLASGQFAPCNAKELGKAITIEPSNVEQIAEEVHKQRYRLICPNDMGGFDNEDDFVRARNMLCSAFERILPQKSRFEI